jgi:hypothetical protein
LWLWANGFGFGGGCLPAVCRDGFGLQVMVALPEFQKSVYHGVRCYGGRWSRFQVWLSSWWLSLPNPRREGCPTKRAADRASPWWYGAGLLAMALVCDGVLPVRPAANADRWALGKIYLREKLNYEQNTNNPH